MVEFPAVPTPHDRLVRRIYARPATAAVLLRCVLPPELLAHLELKRIRVEPTDHIGARLGAGHSDLIYAVPLREGEGDVWVFIPVEHQSTPTDLIPLRMYWYVGWLWDRHMATKGTRLRRIPLVLPVVLVQCPHKWTGPNQLSELFDMPKALEGVIGPPIELKVWVDDMSESVLDDPVADPHVLALVELTRALLFGYHHPASFTASRVAELGCLFDTVLHHYREDAQALWTYVMSVFGVNSSLQRMLVTVVNEENRTMVVTIKDALLAQGMIKGMAKAVLQVLDCRWPVPADLRDRVLSTQDEPTLERWLQRAVAADSLERVFEPAIP